MEVQMELGHKTTILLSPRMHLRLTQLATRRGTSMGALIRRALEVTYGLQDSDAPLVALAELAALSLPVGSPASMKAESIESPGEIP